MLVQAEQHAQCLADPSSKDGDWRACYAILDAGQATFRRVEYDVKAAAAAICATELPHEFAADIESGGRK